MLITVEELLTREQPKPVSNILLELCIWEIFYSVIMPSLVILHEKFIFSLFILL